ncbi:MAG: ribonuclease Y [Planctomycetota bacterium]|nr:ribonuclease Y [Planctomycetota bacterium]
MDSLANSTDSWTTGSVVGIVLLVIGVAVAIASGIMAARAAQRTRNESERSIAEATARADALSKDALLRAEAAAKDIQLKAERAATERRAKTDSDVAEAMSTFKEVQARSQQLQTTLDQRLERISQRETRLDEREQTLETAKTATEAARAEVRKAVEDAKNDALAAAERARLRLEQISGLTREAAREQHLAEVRIAYEHDGQELARSIIETASARAGDEAREITLAAIQRYSGEIVAENTVRAVKIQSEDLKGRLIGREGRNIRALEKATGVDVLIDDTPGLITVSSFDKVRQTIAAEALQTLLADGRIHPGRIEEVVESTKRDMGARILRAGNEAAIEADVRGLNQRVIEALGRLSFRTSYGQNVLRHSIEVAFFCQIIADQLGLDGDLARRCGLLHDIGKAMDHEVTGTHPAIGAEFLQNNGERSEAVLNAVAGHHADIPSTTPYTPIVMAADALSGARPGARRDSMEQYVKRLKQLESIALEQPHVTEAFAIQAGREIRVIIDAAQSDDALAFATATRIAKRVGEELTFPGEIKVTVLREVRAEATAR